MTRRALPAIVWTAIAVITLGCAAQQPPAPPDTRAADEQAIREADIAWTDAASTMDGFLSYYADDVVLLPPNQPIATGKAAVRQAMEPLYQIPGFSVRWQPTKVEVARSSDIGYVYGTYEMTLNDPAGKPMTDRGKYVEIWRKQADGSWKCIVDTFNSDLPATPPATQ